MHMRNITLNLINIKLFYAEARSSLEFKQRLLQLQ